MKCNLQNLKEALIKNKKKKKICIPFKVRCFHVKKVVLREKSYPYEYKKKKKKFEKCYLRYL